MRILGIDYGDARIGIAVSDPLGWTAQAVETINWNYDLTNPIERIKELLEKYECKTVVIGFPRNMNGTVGERGEKTLSFIDIVNDKIPGLKIIKWDERLTTIAAHRAMNEMGVKSKKKKSLVDQIAAVYILQGYLDSRN